MYWLLLTFPSLIAIFTRRGRFGDMTAARANGATVLAMILFFMVYNALSILRYDTGGDWYTYDLLVQQIRVGDFAFALSRGDNAFMAVAYLSTRMGLDLYGVNFVCSALLSWGVLALALRLPDPWVAIAAAVPYILIVIGFGYIRQGAAIGLILLSIIAIVDKAYIRGIVYLVLGLLFHFGTIAVLPFIALALARRNIGAMVGIGIVGLVIISYVFTGARVDTLQAGYLDAGYESSGAGVRLVMNLLPALLFLARRNRLNLDPLERSIWSNFAWFCIVLMAALYLSPSSTAVDRVALFFSPIQIFVFGYALQLLGVKGRNAPLVIVGLLGYSIAVFSVWAFYASHAYLWIPYMSIFERSALA